jgi:two-component system chemotaxis sensor kinase CheA
MSANEDAKIIAAARAGFLDEAADMLHQFEQALLVMETTPDDAENLNAAFRAAHTIKGTAGLFGCDAVVAFTHDVETLMESLRNGDLVVDEDIMAALLDGRDQMEALIREVRSGHADPAVAERSRSLGERLRAVGGQTAAAPAPAAPPEAELSGVAAAAGCWHLSVRFGSDALRNGLDPLAFIRYLAQLGQVQACHTLTEVVPPLAALDAEACHLGFELRLVTDQGQEEIERVFEFALEDCLLAVLPPGAPAARYAALLDDRCGSDAASRAALRAVWQAQGVDFELAPSVPEVAAAAVRASVPPAAERRQPEPDRRSGKDRRPRRPGEEARFVKVRADKLDHLIDLIGELVIAGSGAQMIATREGSAPFLEATQRVADLVQATRDGTLALRMVPVAETFSRFTRVVRDISKQLGKEIDLVVTGGETELDKAMVESLVDPLMHLVRNSLDHGIETPAERLAAGKPRSGRLGLHAHHEAGAIVIEVSDDGAGLGRERILRKAIDRGLVTEGAVLSDAEVWQLIFAAGFSTAEVVTDLSGRGVGMDVVRRNIEALRGQISLTSIEGRGTTTEIRLPLTLAMIDGFLTLVGKVHYVLPLAVVSECIDVPRECMAQPEAVCGTFDLRGEVLPYLDLARFYAEDGQPPAIGRRSLVVVRQGTVRIGIVVDRLLGEHQTVIKPLASIFKPLQALAGSTILGSGEVALVLDMQGLMAAATRPGAIDRGASRPAPRAPSIAPGIERSAALRP